MLSLYLVEGEGPVNHLGAAVGLGRWDWDFHLEVEIRQVQHPPYSFPKNYHSAISKERTPPFLKPLAKWSSGFSYSFSFGSLRDRDRSIPNCDIL